MIDVVTWNLNGLDERRLDERSEAACLHLLLHDPPDVVLLQEVVRRSLFAHLRPHFAAAGFVVVPSTPDTDSEYFCVVAVRGMQPVAAWRRPLPRTCMGRALTAVEVERHGARWLFTTGHLESGRDRGRERSEQVGAVVAALAEHPGPALFGGDTNLVEGEAAIDGAADAWEVAGRPAAGALTWRPERGRGGARFDRVWLGPAGVWRVEALAVGGDRRVEGVPLSDHRWVRARLGWQAAGR